MTDQLEKNKNGNFLNMNKISVIIPVYNVEQYLRECLDSIINQTYKHLEIILINDGSTDRSPQICDEYSNKDNRIKVIHQQNSGAAEARNNGMKISSGNYMAFVDSDDVISNKMFEVLIQKAIDFNADIVECDISEFLCSKEIINSIDLNKSKNQLTVSYSTEEGLEAMMNGILRQVIWNKLYIKRVINNIKFEKGRLIDDEFWTYKVIGKATKIIKIPQVLYYYRQQQGSIIRSVYSIRRLDGLDALKGRIRYMSEHFPNLLFLAKKTYCFAGMYHCQIIQKNNKIDSNKFHRRNIVKGVKEEVDHEFLANLSFKQRCWLQLFLLMPARIAFIRNKIRIGL